MKLVIVAGGTGGHVYPGLAVADALQKQSSEHTVDWIGTEAGIEARVVPQAAIPLHLIAIKGLRGKGLVARLRGMLFLFHAIFSAIALLRELKPDAVLGMGGYVAGPVGVAAWLLRVPLVIHEQNARMGMTNRLLARLARRVIWGLPNPMESQYQKKGARLGNPVRAAFSEMPAPDARLLSRCEEAGYRRRLLVLGGSLGASAMNEALPAICYELANHYSLEVVHQCGQKHLEATIAAYEDVGLYPNEAPHPQATVAIQVLPFVDNLAEYYQWADWVICRAGALTVSELAVAGLGAIMVPYPHAVDDHQAHNAQSLVAVGAGQIVPQGEAFPARLAAAMKEWVLLDWSELCQKAQNAQKIAAPSAASDIVALLLEEGKKSC